MIRVNKDGCDSFKTYLLDLPCRLQLSPSDNGFMVGDCGKFLMYVGDEIHTNVFVSFKVKNIEVVVLNSERVNDSSLYTLIHNTARIAHWLDHCNQALECIDESLARHLCDEVFPDLLNNLSPYMTAHSILLPVFDIRDTQPPSVTFSEPVGVGTTSGFCAQVYQQGVEVSARGNASGKSAWPINVVHQVLIALMISSKCLEPA